MKLKVKTKRFIALLVLIAFLLIPVWYYNNFTLKTVSEAVTSNKINSEIRIVTISDLHSSKFGKGNQMVLEEIKSLSPDLIFYLGDIYSRGQTHKIDEAVAFLEKLSVIADTYVITGDHDTDEEYKEKLLNSTSVRFLSYEKKDITVNGNNLSIYGIDNVYFSSTFDLINEFAPPEEDKVNILLSHIPEIDLFGDFGFDFIFCGDTHGGMVRLPFLNGLYYKGYLLPKLTYKGQITDKGIYEFENTKLFVTSGLGNYPLPMRFNNRPEICLITIKGE